MMLRSITCAAVLAALASAVPMPTDEAARAATVVRYDPCERAVERAQEAERRFNRWKRNYCDNPRNCNFNAYGGRLFQEQFDAWQEAAAACR